MHKIEIPHKTLLERLSDTSLTEDMREVKEEWLGLFNEEEFKTIFHNVFLRIGNNIAVKDKAKVKMLAGSFENFYFLREYLDNLKVNKKDKWYGKPKETNAEFLALLKYAKKKVGKDTLEKSGNPLFCKDPKKR